ncbi:MAG TPA: ArsB/NhaD family transporter [Dehalococcoidia bacterium]|nr:ArsB/NhaD family transporter [Dehalococcoidia bacterium]
MELVSQIVAIVIFIVMFVAVISDKWHRFIPALVGAGFTIVVVFLIIMKSPESVFNVLSFGQLIEPAFWVPGDGHFESHGINWQTVVFIGGMMVMVEGLGEVGFFRWLCLYVAKLVNYKVVPILIAFMLLSGFLAMFIDSITVMLFLATVTIELARLLKFDPVPIIIAEIFASNVGGSATMSGDPPNIIIGTAFGYSFFDFVTNTGVIAWIGMIAVVIFFYFAFRKALKESQGEVDESNYPDPSEAIVNPRAFGINTGIFAFVVLLIVTHAETGIAVSLIGVIAAALTLIAGYRKVGHLMKRVDWKTLLFFIGLFICVGGLEETGVLKILAEFIAEVSGGNLMIVIPLILWISAFASAIVDNIPFAATMIPVLRGLASTGLPLPAMAWTLALGSDIGGNATPIGASANVVGTAVAAREGYPISWGRFCKYALPAMIIVVGMCWLYLTIRYV